MIYWIKEKIQHTAIISYIGGTSLEHNHSDITHRICFKLTLFFDTPIKLFSLVSMFIQDRNSIPKSSNVDQSLTNQHLASATETPSRDKCWAMICLETALTLHFGGAMRFLIVLMKSGLYLPNYIQRRMEQMLLSCL